ncbi:hypothetical protein QCA50_018994 [Cerrena zonata]|uniref:AB hydrolase-1 domain-containing protein n=1 Tax=Cerrena zonata TaxID=2478898 RepID=A0AAW0FA84_9APHY
MLFLLLFPRSTPDIDIPPPVFSQDKAEWKQRVENKLNELTGLKEKQALGELDHLPNSEKPLWCVVDRYIRANRKYGNHQGVTLFFAHANGFNKETWEPTLQSVVQSLKNVDVAEIWLWQSVNHGDAAIINSANLCGLYDWQDNARDILHFLLNHIPSSTYEDFPTHLPRLSSSIAESRKSFGFSGRQFVAVGHSYGGCSVALAAVNHPSLFSSIIFVDPMIRALRPDFPLVSFGTRRKTSRALSRRNHWSSREEARRLFLKSPFFQAWDPAVLDAYVQHGLIEDPNSGGVKLKMPGFQEAVVFAESLTTYEGWLELDKLPETIGLRWIMPGKLPEQERVEKQELVWRRPSNSSNAIIHSAGHLIPHESPQELAYEIASFLQRKYGVQPPASRL